MDSINVHIVSHSATLRSPDTIVLPLLLLFLDANAIIEKESILRSFRPAILPNMRPLPFLSCSFAESLHRSSGSDLRHVDAELALR